MSRGINRMQVSGNVGADAIVRFSPSKDGGDAKPVVSFVVATDESYVKKNGEKVELTEWHSVSVFDFLAEKEFIQNIKKGQHVYIEGRVKTSTWLDEQSKEKKYKKVIIASYIVPSIMKNEPSPVADKQQD